ncbi:FAD/NAD P-binding domain-containing protein [Pseudohyphozyma bogoriensis]|nr:FAD/NAD P-binding domain-containing protein [Pseudohyphozyma bogoriensis]
MLWERSTQFLLAVGALLSPSLGPSGARQEAVQEISGKRIAIVGGGSGGLGVLAALLTLPEEVRKEWTIDLFEQRRDVGGVWLPDENPPEWPQLPETPLYPALRTNTPHPTMTYPHFPFPPLTPLYPTHDYLQRYHAHFARHFNLTPYISLNTTVTSASYSHATKWSISLDSGEIEQRNGTTPEKYANRTVVVVGFSASGSDIAIQTVPLATKVYHSYTTNHNDPSGRQRVPIPGTHYRPRISHFDGQGIVFLDGSRIDTPGPTSVILGTGYRLTIPWLEPLTSVAEHTTERRELATNERYIRPLHRHVFAVDESLPVDALAFVGLPVWIANSPSDYAQGLFIAHQFASGRVVGRSKEDLWRVLEQEEEEVRRKGNDPFWIGHRFPTEGSAEDYQDALVARARTASPYPFPPHLANITTPYVESWRRRGRTNALLMRNGWLRAEQKGVAKGFLEGARTEDDWVEVMERVLEWEREHKDEEGLVKGYVVA